MPSERLNRSSNYGSFHHRCFDNSDKKNHNTLKVSPHRIVASKDSIFQDSTSEPLLSPDHILQIQSFQISQDKTFNSQTLSEDQISRYNSKPFVSLGNMNGPPAWIDEEPIKNESVDFPTYVTSESDQTLELPRLVSCAFFFFFFAYK